MRGVTALMQAGGRIVTKRCPVCHRDVLSAHRGEITAVGRAEIAKVARDGSVIGRCECGAQTTWEREVSRGR
jgi:hypothetical protein